MHPPGRAEATRELLNLSHGDAGAAGRLQPIVYAELRALAAGIFRGEAAGHTLQPTALVHEVWMKLFDGDGIEWRGRAQFRALAATAMRHILADHARARLAQKRGGGAQQVTLVEPMTPSSDAPIDLVELNEVLDQLAQLDARQHRIVEMRFFGGLSVEEAASVLDVSTTTIEREWRAARAWLSARLRKDAQA